MLLASLPAESQCPSGPEDIHANTICGLSIGMKPDQVLAIMKRPPDEGQEQNGDIVSAWKLPKGNILVVRFRKKQFVGALSLDFHPELMARDLELPASRVEELPLGTSGSRYDPKRKLEYHIAETQNSENLIWYREVQAPGGYTFEVGFQSPSRLKKLGERFSRAVVASKYITVRKGELAKLDEAMSTPPAKPPGPASLPPPN